MSLDQAKIMNLEREQGEIKDQFVQIFQTLQPLVVIQNQNQPQQVNERGGAHRREVVVSESEASSQYEALEEESEEEEQPIWRNNNQRWNQEPRDNSKAEILEFDRKTQIDELLE